MDKQLQEEDVVFGISDLSMQKYVIDRVTKTMAFSRNTRFKRAYGDGHISVPGDSGFSRQSYQVSTPELQAEYVRLYYIRKVKNIAWEKCSINTLKSVIELVEN